MYSTHSMKPGSPSPLGASINRQGINFALFSRHAEAVTLLLYDREDQQKPSRRIPLDFRKNRTGDVWHVQVDGLGAGQLYLYQADGPWAPGEGHRFNRRAPLIDPYARALTRSPEPWTRWRRRGTPRCVAVGGGLESGFDWEGDRPLNYPLRETVIYEAHPAGITRGRGSGTASPGTYRGVIDRIPYLKELGITSLELLPVHAFNPAEFRRKNPVTGEPLENYWGYSTVNFFSPAVHYAQDQSPGGAVREFREMVKALHREGIELILDVVYNHTAEGGEGGPTFSYRGLDNAVYYLRDDKGGYANYSGCGNTLNTSHPVVRRLILDSLRYWVEEMHVDGFRFDLASILGRDARGELREDAPLVEEIAEDPLLRGTKLIAEAWDAGGAYQVGRFHTDRWAEWNDRFRDDLRNFWLGTPGMKGALAMRFAGSEDLYRASDADVKGRKPFHSINFITSHDGFTLNDLVSYSRKHNRANGENNRDGHGHNIASGYGEEGPTEDPEIQAVRRGQVKNFLASLLLSSGTPMLTAGDEFRRSQGGNNNAYCQNNPLAWIDWTLLERYPGIYRLCRELIAYRKRHPAFSRPEFFSGEDSSLNGMPDIAWYGEDGRQAQWEQPGNFLALVIDGNRREILAERDDRDFLLIFNGENRAIRFPLVPLPHGRKWRFKMDTSLPAPRDIKPREQTAPLKDSAVYPVQPRSTVLLAAEPEGKS